MILFRILNLNNKIETLEDVAEIKECALKIFRNFKMRTEKYIEAQTIFLQLTEHNTRSCHIDDINKIKQKFRDYDAEITTKLIFQDY